MTSTSIAEKLAMHISVKSSTVDGVTQCSTISIAAFVAQYRMSNKLNISNLHYKEKNAGFCCIFFLWSDRK